MPVDLEKWRLICNLIADTGVSVVHWQWQFDAWQAMLADTQRLLQQIAHGAGRHLSNSLNTAPCLCLALLPQKRQAHWCHYRCCSFARLCQCRQHRASHCHLPPTSSPDGNQMHNSIADSPAALASHATAVSSDWKVWNQTLWFLRWTNLLLQEPLFRFILFGPVRVWTHTYRITAISVSTKSILGDISYCRYSVLSPPPLELLSACLDVATCFVDSRPKEVMSQHQP